MANENHQDIKDHSGCCSGCECGKPAVEGGCCCGEVCNCGDDCGCPPECGCPGAR